MKQPFLLRKKTKVSPCYNPSNSYQSGNNLPSYQSDDESVDRERQETATRQSEEESIAFWGGDGTRVQTNDAI